ncbi:uncharacterized protein LOC116114825 [Pistacia vera]|uniref:uncharacterized protein LOC116114825 n=1 Tax=Pistacia vera TaxID=55513 RepID=UPI001262B6D5|nr:uncharacterized protein LOC116114825 [Pistacia vera]
MWTVKMKTFLRGQVLWLYVEENKQPPTLGPNPTLNQIRHHEEEATKAPRALSHIHVAVTELVFTRIMVYETAKEAWDKLKKEFGGSDTTRNMQLLGEEMTYKRIMEKVLVSLPERFESKISSLEDSKDLSHITLTELVHALQAQKQRRSLRQEDSSEGAMVAGFKGKAGQGGNKRSAAYKKGKEKISN